jgi:DNA-binding transcriptional MerR regulator
MKLKEVCTETGLSRKTIRLYEEKGLLVPRKEYRNGREYREYSEKDVARLKQIALLRKAMFTMEEIHRMQEDPEAIQEIFPQYRQWLRQQKLALEELISAAEQVKVQEVENIEELAACMEAAEQLPLPQWDCQPHFRYLDEIEEVRTMKKKQTDQEWTNPLGQGVADNRTYRQFVASSSKTHDDDLAVAFGQLHEAVDDIQQGKQGPVEREYKGPCWLRNLSRVGLWVAALSFVLLFVTVQILRGSGGNYHSLLVAEWGVVVLGLATYGIGRVVTAYLEHQRWLNLVREQEQEKQEKRN